MQPTSVNQDAVVVKTAPELHDVVKRILMAAGADARNAERVGESLVSANLCGVDTHGLWQLAGYVERIGMGGLNPTAWPEILAETPTSALVSGNWTFGHVTAKYATEIAIEKARQQNVAVVGMVRVNHIGRLGEYAELAASQGLISIVVGGGMGVEVPNAVPYGGSRPLLSTNPIAMGFPAGQGTPVILDIATTALSGVKVVLARDKHRPLPPDCIVDREGNPTTDAAKFFEGGAYLPFGGHKGYGLMLAAEFLGRILTGADAFAAKPWGAKIFSHSGASIVAIRADMFGSLDQYSRCAEEMERKIRAVPPAPGFREVLVPGDPEARTRQTRLRDGIPIPQQLWQQVTELAASLGVEEGLY